MKALIVQNSGSISAQILIQQLSAYGIQSTVCPPGVKVDPSFYADFSIVFVDNVSAGTAMQIRLWELSSRDQSHKPRVLIIGLCLDGTPEEVEELLDNGVDDVKISPLDYAEIACLLGDNFVILKG